MKQILFMMLFLLAFQMQNNVFAQSKTAHVDTKLLMDTLPSRKKALAEIQEVTKRSEAELIELDKQLQKVYNDYAAGKKEWTPQVIQYEESRLQKMQQELQNRERDLNSNIQNMTIAMNDYTYKKVQEAVKTIANKKGILYVLDKATAIYSGGPDMTNEVMTELLNQR